ncbi:exocyst complex component secretory 8 [Lycorma delicatula]|uniref:exocyst complex component secretory 8 n=1 Tax=Lycorma delicatula TaxID=130591 RepID=UPI003F517104
MSAVPPPTKPPRGIKSPKETSGLLMNVIRTLSTSESNEQRDKEKAKLEKDYKKSDQQLDELISLYDKELALVMQTFSKVSSLVNRSREKIRVVKENLHECKKLLSCRRDELKKLWVEGIEHKHTLQLLEEINQLQEVPSQLNNFMARKHYLHATQLLVSQDGISLKGADGLSELRDQLAANTQKLHSKLLEELSHHIYVHSTQEVLQGRLLRQGSGRDRDATPVKREHNPAESSRARKMLDFSSHEPRLEFNSNDLIEDIDQPDPEKNSEHFMAILIECLALLKKLPDAVEHLKVQMQPELLKLVERTTRTLLPADSASSSPLLLDLLYLLMEQFRLIAAAHRTVLTCLTKASRSHHIHLTLYDLPDFWSRVQSVLQLVLTAYLDIQNTNTENQQVPSAFSDQTNDISTYFARRKQQRSRKSLFKFEYSSHAQIKNNYVQDKHSKGSGIKVGDNQRERLLVCPPNPHNITLIFIPLSQFLLEIEEAMGCGPQNPCTLNAFVYNYVKDMFVRRQHIMMMEKVEAATKCADAWRAATSSEACAALGLPKPLLQSTVIVEECMREVQTLMEALPSHAVHLLDVMYRVAHNYRETCLAAYRGIVQPHPEDKRVCSAAWLNDEDINRFLKSLPNWTDLKAQKHLRKSFKREDTVEEESPEDVRQRNMKEAEMLASNLGESGVSSHEIISEPAQLKCLAQLQESMEWFAFRISEFISGLKKTHHKESVPMAGVPTISVINVDGIPAVPESSVQPLEQLAVAFEELANTCLLVLHLEVRVQCFYYLLPHGGGPGTVTCGSSQDPDPKVLELSRVLASIDEAMASSLQARKSKYVFEGLGHLIAKILMSSVQFVEKIDEGCIRKMCRNIFTLQQTLTNITLTREIALDHARHYFELFYLTPDEILNQVMEKGPEFTELEYMNAFQLIHKSKPDLTEPNAIQRHMQRLSDILGEVGVTV